VALKNPQGRGLQPRAYAPRRLGFFISSSFALT
jgi:hypothetical protein